MTPMAHVLTQSIARRVVRSLGYGTVTLTNSQLATVARITARIRDIHVRNAAKRAT